MRRLPQLRRAFLLLNRWFAVPALRAGLGPLFVTPWTGSIMLLRTRGRRSGEWREAPLGYLIADGAVYCCAGFGESTHWLQNLRADPCVEVLLPGRALRGLAEEVSDPTERARAMRALLESMSVISRPLLPGPPMTSDGEVLRRTEGLPLVRIRVTGLAPGPWDPGGSGWYVTRGVSLALGAVLLYRRFRRRGPRC